MTRRTALLIAAVGAALVPGNAAAVDHVTLFVSPTKLSQSGWKLSAAVVGATSPGARETFGLSLTRTLGNGRGEEQHGLRAAPSGTVSFDGRTGRWAARFGTVVAIGMIVTATGQAREVGESLGCRGAFATVPVRLRGKFVLRTGTSFFGTIRRLELAGAGQRWRRSRWPGCASPRAPRRPSGPWRPAVPRRPSSSGRRRLSRSRRSRSRRRRCRRRAPTSSRS